MSEANTITKFRAFVESRIPTEEASLAEVLAYPSMVFMDEFTASTPSLASARFLIFSEALASSLLASLGLADGDITHSTELIAAAFTGVYIMLTTQDDAYIEAATSSLEQALAILAGYANRIAEGDQAAVEAVVNEHQASLNKFMQTFKHGKSVSGAPKSSSDVLMDMWMNSGKFDSIIKH